MSKIKCPACGKEIDYGVRFCPWCGSQLSYPDSPNVMGEDSRYAPHQEGNEMAGDSSTSSIGDINSSTSGKEWPEEDKSVSFTIYDSEDEPDEVDEPEYEVESGWRKKHIWIGVLLVLLSAVVVLLMYVTQESSDARMPDYDRVVEKQQLKQEKRDKKLEQQRQDAQLLEQELKRAAEEERLKAQQEAQEEQIDEEFDDSELLEEEVESRLQELEELLN